MHWLLLINGQVVIGTRGNNGCSWTILKSNATVSAVNDEQVVDAREIPTPKVRCTNTTEIAFAFAEE